MPSLAALCTIFVSVRAPFLGVVRLQASRAWGADIEAAYLAHCNRALALALCFRSLASFLSATTRFRLFSIATFPSSKCNEVLLEEIDLLLHLPLIHRMIFALTDWRSVMDQSLLSGGKLLGWNVESELFSCKDSSSFLSSCPDVSVPGFMNSRNFL